MSQKVEKINFEIAGLYSGQANKAQDQEVFEYRKKYREIEKREQIVEIQCYPFYALIEALGNPTIHYFSLDVEGT